MKTLSQKNAVCLLLPVFLLGIFLLPGSAAAQSETGYDVIA